MGLTTKRASTSLKEAELAAAGSSHYLSAEGEDPRKGQTWMSPFPAHKAEIWSH